MQDITVKIPAGRDENGPTAADLQNLATLSEGVLCFSLTDENAIPGSSEASAVQLCFDGCIIRIPGPQVSSLVIRKAVIEYLNRVDSGLCIAVHSS